MGYSAEDIRLNTKLIARSGGAMYGGAAFLGLIEGFLPGGPSFSIVPGLVALALAAGLVTLGPRVPRRALAPLGPIGVVLIGYALATTHGSGDGAVLYMWPVLWTTFFFGRRGAVGIVAFLGLVHAVVLVSLPPGLGYVDRWLDVMVSALIVSLIVEALAERNGNLVSRLAGEARTDTLTRLLNRRGFDERASVEIAHARRESSIVALVSFDLDYFKLVNDEWGHETGDRVLARVGKVLADRARDVDVVARVGGEEFVVMLPMCTAEEACSFAARVRAALADLGDPAIPNVRVSAGVTAAVAPGDAEELLKRADSALYAAKRAGRNRTVVDESVTREVAGRGPNAMAMEGAANGEPPAGPAPASAGKEGELGLALTAKDRQVDLDTTNAA